MIIAIWVLVLYNTFINSFGGIAMPDKNHGGNPFFTIIMPCYNSEAYVERAIDSCINQDYENWELIVVNDGSTDHTLDILNEYASEDCRISIYSKENGGYVSAVNFGLDYVRGKYFMFLGSDDELCPDLLAEIHSHAEATLPDFVCFRTRINKNNALIKDKKTNFDQIAEAYNTSVKSFSTEYPKESTIIFSRDTSKLYKSELLGSLRYLGKKGMDADGIFSMMFSHKATSFLCVPVDGYIWHLRDESLSGRKKDYITQLDRINNWINFSEFIKKLPPDEITGHEKNYLTYYFFKVFKHVVFYNYFRCIRCGDIKKIKDYLNNILVSLDYKSTNKEIKFFLKHTILWTIFILPKFIIEKITKK